MGTQMRVSLLNLTACVGDRSLDSSGPSRSISFMVGQVVFRGHTIGAQEGGMGGYGPGAASATTGGAPRGPWAAGGWVETGRPLALYPSARWEHGRRCVGCGGRGGVVVAGWTWKVWELEVEVR